MPILRLVVVMTAAGLGLAACGVRGDPEPPPGAEAVATQQAERTAVEAPAGPGPDADLFAEDDGESTERVIQSQRRTIYPPMSDSFVLDPLL